MSAERPVPSLEILIGAIGEVDNRVTDLAQTMEGSANLTDSVLLELSLQVAFIMQTLRITEVMQGGLAGPDGKVPSVTKTGAQVYLERGRAMMLKQREAMQRAQGLSTEPPAPGGDAAAGKTNGEAKDAIIEHVGPKRVTH